eukprot:4905301-Prorocentrum_lima.AAC.1
MIPFPLLPCKPILFGVPYQLHPQLIHQSTDWTYPSNAVYVLCLACHDLRTWSHASLCGCTTCQLQCD